MNAPKEPPTNPYASPRSISPRQEKRSSGLIPFFALFLVMSVIGSGAIYGFWSNQDTSIGLTRSFGFVVIMAGVHFVGYRTWRREKQLAAKQEEHNEK